MISLLFSNDRSTPLKVLCLGAHCDDIEIGCGGTILRLQEWYPKLEIRWLVLSSNEERRAETRASATRFGLVESDKSVHMEAFRDGYLPYVGAEVKQAIHDHGSEFEPDVVFTHYRNDRHQDHRMVSDVTWNAYRDHLILEYEIPKWDGDLGTPNFFVPLDAAHVENKLTILQQEYNSQQMKESFRLEAFRGLMALRGVEAKSTGGYAEAFYARKLVVGPTES